MAKVLPTLVTELNQARGDERRRPEESSNQHRLEGTAKAGRDEGRRNDEGRRDRRLETKAEGNDEGTHASTTGFKQNWVSIKGFSIRELIFSLWFIEKNETGQSFIKVDSHDKFQVMLSMYEVEKELSVYVTTTNNFETSSMQQRGTGDVHDEESEYSLNDGSYHSHYSIDQEVEKENSAMVLH
ncbi:hypothetical protein L1987_30288 [Smallanthus sonchifolius]|uniref:Uncharacterized protein n=1 Tax=Smallanthus sonchifolius TaxID=185202 RepID=A0ACB9I462_9ASTR|nr:hypothetical protein L1987_30288 [Smallanthus sonchifolius]